jgi:hypothetical protein
VGEQKKLVVELMLDKLAFLLVADIISDFARALEKIIVGEGESHENTKACQDNHDAVVDSYATGFETHLLAFCSTFSCNTALKS